MMNFRFILIPVFAVLCALGLSHCTHSFSHTGSLSIRDTDGKAISGADVYLLSARKYPVPLPWLSAAWNRTLDIQNQFHQTSNAQGDCQISIPAHSTFYETSDFYIIICKDGFVSCVVPLLKLKQGSVIIMAPEQQSYKLYLQRSEKMESDFGSPSVLCQGELFDILWDCQTSAPLRESGYLDRKRDVFLYFPELIPPINIELETMNLPEEIQNGLINNAL